MDRLNDAAKLAMFDDLQETAEELRIVNAELREELERCEKRFSVLAWNLECALAIAKNFPMPTDEEDPPKKAGKRKVGGGKTATPNAALRRGEAVPLESTVMQQTEDLK
jgi:hypothetical protein